MIISRTPFRISFFGGGTECPNWYRNNGASVLSASVDKYCYISCRILPPFFEHKIRLVYSQIENCRSIDEIQHPAVREILRFMQIDYGLEIHHDGDLPAHSGVGSSSSFTVGLLHALHAQLGVMPTKKRLALESIHIEHDILKESDASQDQICAAYGGFNKIDCLASGEFGVHPITLLPERIEELNSHLMLFFTGVEAPDARSVEDVARKQGEKDAVLKRMQEMVREGIDLLQSSDDICRFGKLLDESRTLEKSLKPKSSKSGDDELYKRACKAGAVGGKTTGVGGSGFMLLLVPPPARESVQKALSKIIHVPFHFEFGGSQIIFYKPDREDYKRPHTKEARQPATRVADHRDTKEAQRIEALPIGKTGKSDTVQAAVPLHEDDNTGKQNE